MGTCYADDAEELPPLDDAPESYLAFNEDTVTFYSMFLRKNEIIEILKSRPEVKKAVIHINWTGKIGEDGYRNLSQLTHLESLHFSVLKHPIIEDLTDENFRYLQSLVNLKHLDLAENRLTPEGYKMLDAFPKLESLCIKKKEMNFGEFKVLCSNKNLQKTLKNVSVRSSSIFSNDMKYLLLLENVTALDLAKTYYPEGFLEVLATSKNLTQNLKELDLSYNDYFCDFDLTPFKNLEKLNLSHCLHITDQDIQGLLPLENLKELNVSYSPYVTRRCLKEFKKLRPNCKIIYKKGPPPIMFPGG